MRNPNQRMHVHLGVGRRDAPRPATAEDLGARVGYAVGRHIPERKLPVTRGSPLRYPAQGASPPEAAPRIQGIQALGVRDVAVSNAVLQHSLLLAQVQVQELMAASRRKDEFLAILVHELRSPLCAIGYAAGLMSKHTSDTAQPLPALIERQVLRMTELVDEALDVSRVTNGLLSLYPERIDLRVVVDHAIETLQSDIMGRSQHMTSRLPEDPVWVMGDGRRLEQVFVNLIANASRYTDKGGTLTTWMYSEAGEAVVRIRDSGIGIAPDSLPDIFELFRQAHASDPRSKAGLGVGLALVRQLIELHGGRVTAASEGIGRGSEFTINLPAMAAWWPAAVESGSNDAMARQDTD